MITRIQSAFVVVEYVATMCNLRFEHIDPALEVDHAEATDHFFSTQDFVSECTFLAASIQVSRVENPSITVTFVSPLKKLVKVRIRIHVFTESPLRSQ